MGDQEENGEEGESPKFPKGIIFILSSLFFYQLFHAAMKAKCSNRERPTDFQLYQENDSYRERLLIKTESYSHEKYENMCMVIIYIYYISLILIAIVTDCFVEKFRFMCICHIVNTLSSLSILFATLWVHKNIQEYIVLTSLSVISISSGGLKILYIIHGFDEFVLPKQDYTMRMVLSIYYIIINIAYAIGSLTSGYGMSLFGIELTWLNENILNVIFTIISILSLVLLLLGKNFYTKHKKIKEYILPKVGGCIVYAVFKKIKNKSEQKEHWLYHAEPEFQPRVIEHTRIFLNVIIIFIPLPAIWALYSFQLTQWPIQIQHSDAYLGPYMGTISPQETDVINPMTVIILIPITDFMLYPLLEKLRLIKPSQPLRKMSLGGLLVALSFVACAIVETELQKTYEIPPSKGEGQWKLFNGLNCSMTVLYENNKMTAKLQVKPLAYEFVEEIECHHAKRVPAKIYLEDNCQSYSNKNWSGRLPLKEKRAIAIFVTYRNNTLTTLRVPGYYRSNKTDDVYLSILYNIEQSFVLKIKNGKKERQMTLLSTSFYTEQEDLDGMVGTCELFINDTLNSDIELNAGGLYTLIITEFNGVFVSKVVTVVPPNTFSVYWLLPQYILIALGEILFNISGLYFSLMQSPHSIRTAVVGIFIGTLCLGDMIVQIFKRFDLYKHRASDFAFFAAVLIFVMDNFMLLAYRYKYVNIFSPENQQ